MAKRLLFRFVLIALPVLVFLSLCHPTSSQQEDSSAYNARGLEQYKAKKYSEAAALYQQAIKLKKDNAEAHLNLGDAYFKLREYKKAVESYRNAIKYQPSLALAFNNLGNAYYQLGERKKAIAAYKEAIRVDPKLTLPYQNLVLLYVEDENTPEALEEYRALKPIDPELAQRLYLRIERPLATVFSASSGVRFGVMVRDAGGNPVSGLTREDFTVVDGGQAQTITNFSAEKQTLLLGLALDTSGSMQPAINEEVALSKLIVQANEPGDETFLIRFISSDKIETVQEFTADAGEVVSGLDTLYAEGGQSAIVDAVYLVAQRVARYKTDEATYLRRAVVLLTDGDERASYYDLNGLLGLLRRIDVQIFVICLNKGEGPGLNRSLVRGAQALLEKIAAETGGVAFFPKDEPELNANVRQLIALLHKQYSVSYQPATAPTTGVFHRINVSLTKKMNQEKMSGVVRTGYVVKP